MRLLFVVGLWVCSLPLSGYGPGGLTGSDDGAPLSPTVIRQIVDDHPTGTSEASALVLDLSTKTVMWSHNPDVPRAPASLTKLMTALLILESNRDLNRPLLVSARAAATPGSRMGLGVGARLSEFDLLAGLLLPSGNDAAVALAESLDGSVESFVTHMQTRSRSLGLRGTSFRTVHGLDVPGQTSTAHDLATIAELDMRNATFNTLTATRETHVRGLDGVDYHLTNLNELLSAYDGADGVKTGTTPDAGQNLIASATRNGHRVVAVILGSTDRYADARILLDYAWARWQWVSPEPPGFAVITVTGPDGGAASGHLRSPSGSSIPVPAWQAGLATYELATSDAEGARPYVTGATWCPSIDWTCGGSPDTRPLTVNEP